MIGSIGFDGEIRNIKNMRQPYRLIWRPVKLSQGVPNFEQKGKFPTDTNGLYDGAGKNADTGLFGFLGRCTLASREFGPTYRQSR